MHCCDLLPDGGYCPTCDNTQPPSNCGPREPYGGKEEPKNFDPNNGAVFHDRDQTIQKTFILKILEIMFLMMVAQVAKKEVLIQTESLKETVLNNKILNLLFLCYIRFYKFHSYTALD